MADNFGDLIKVLILGFVISLLYGTLGLMVSSFTSRKGVAIAMIVIGFMVVAGVTHGLAQQLDHYSWSRWILAFDVSTLMNSLSNHFFKDMQTNTMINRANFTLTENLAVIGLFTLISVVILRWRYAARDDA